MNQTNVSNASQVGTFVRPHFRAYDAYYHANAKGTGSAVKISLHPAHDDTAGSIFISMAMQRTTGSMQNGGQTFPTFDWAKGICVKLDRSDIAHVLQVLRGMQESIQDDKGLFHRSSAGNTVIKFSHQIDPRPSYVLSLWRKPPTGDSYSAFYVFDMNEAFALMLSLERALMYVCFGIPEVFPRRVPVATPASAPMSAPPTLEPSLDDDLLLASGDDPF